MNKKPLSFASRALRLSALYILVYFGALYLLKPFGLQAIANFSKFVPIVLCAIATIVARQAWLVRHTWQKKTWKFWTIGLAFWLASEVISALIIWFQLADWLIYLAGIVRLCGYPAMIIACYHFLKANRFALTPAKEALAVVVGALIPFMLFMNFIQPINDQGVYLTVVILIIAALFPALDFVVAAGALLCLLVSGPKPWRRPWFLILIAMAIFAYADLWYWFLLFFRIGVGDLGRVIRADIPYGMAYILLIVGSWQVIDDEYASRTRPVADLHLGG